MRMRNKKNKDARIEKCRGIWIENPEAVKGRWAEEFPVRQPLHIEIGCGKGAFITGMAKMHTNINYVAVEKEKNVIVLAMEKAVSAGLTNIRFVIGDASGLEDFFAPNEFERMYINFCDPWPKNKNAKRRLTHSGFLEMYKRLLKPGDFICFKTDNKSLFEFSLNSFAGENFKLRNITFDLHASGIEGNIMTEYEERFSKEGMPIYRLEAEYTR